jgi:hypothetical protein
MKNQFNVDFDHLSNKISRRAYRLDDVKDQIEKVGFDVVRFKDADKGAELWQVQSADDGDYIVAMYDEEPEEKIASWQVCLTKNASLQISYKGDPMIKLSAQQLGIPADQLHQAEHYLPSKLASNPKLVKSLLKELPYSAKQEVIKRYPELTGEV